MSRFKFKKGDYVEIVRVYKNDIKKGLNIGMRGYILEDFATKPFVNFIDNNLKFEECACSDNDLSCYVLKQNQLKLVKKREANKMEYNLKKDLYKMSREISKKEELNNMRYFKFKKNDYVEVERVTDYDKRIGLCTGMRGYVLEECDMPCINFVDKELDINKCKKLKEENNNNLYCWTMFDFQLKLVEEQEEGK